MATTEAARFLYIRNIEPPILKIFNKAHEIAIGFEYPQFKIHSPVGFINCWVIRSPADPYSLQLGLGFFRFAH
jgi:hypothetical protein